MIVATVKKMDDLIMRVEQKILALLLFVMMCAIFWAVLDRFIFKSGQVWLEEFSRYVSVWAAFIGAGLGVKKGAHIGIEAFVQILPPRIKKLADLFVSLVGALFAGSVVVISFSLLEKLMMMKQLSPALRIPVYWAYLAVPVGCALMLIHYVFATVVCLSEARQGVPSKGVECS